MNLIKIHKKPNCRRKNGKTFKELRRKLRIAKIQIIFKKEFDFM